MAPMRGFFSVIQFCPDLDRGECANVGVILMVPPLGFLDVRFSENNDAPKLRFGRDAYDDVRLTVAKKALEGRLRQEGKGWSSPEDIQRFARREGNHLLLTTPKVMLVENATAELEELFNRLVQVPPQIRRHQPKPNLKAVFEEKLYGYRNGVLNLVRPEGFPIDEKAATTKADELAVKGHLIHKLRDNTGKGQKLVVVGGFDASAPEALKRRIDYVLSEHDTRLIREERIAEFVEEVRREAA